MIRDSVPDDDEQRVYFLPSGEGGQRSAANCIGSSKLTRIRRGGVFCSERKVWMTKEAAFLQELSAACSYTLERFSPQLNLYMGTVSLIRASYTTVLLLRTEERATLSQVVNALLETCTLL